MVLASIATRQKNQAPMQEHDAIDVLIETGLDKDYRRRPGKRQVTVLSKQQWELACSECKAELPWTTRRANLLVDGVAFSEAMLGDIIKIGDLELKIMAETEPCEKMDKQFFGLRGALTPDWRGGVCCKVIHEGHIAVGDLVEILT